MILMFLHIGGEVMVPLNELIIILDLKKVCCSEATREFLSFEAGEKRVVHISDHDREKSIVITKNKVYYSPISINTLVKRSQNKKIASYI